MEFETFDSELYELGFSLSKVFKKVKRVGKKVFKRVEKVAKKAVDVAGSVIGGTIGTAIYAADQYLDSYQVPPPSPRRAPRPGVYATYETGTGSSYITFPRSQPNQSWEKYLPLIVGGGALLLLAGRK